MQITHFYMMYLNFNILKMFDVNDFAIFNDLV